MDKSSKKNIGVLIVTSIFLIIAITFIFIGYYNAIVNWMYKFGVGMAIVCSPIIVFIVYKIIINKIKGM